MDIQDGIKPVRKLAIFLATLYPGLARAGESTAAWLRRLIEHPRVAPTWNRIAASGPGRATGALWKRFAWRDYGKDKVNWQAVPPDAARILRPIFAVTALLVLCLPIARALGDPAAGQTAPTWAMALWTLAAPLCWAALLTGAALTNRALLVAISALAAWLLGPAAMDAPPHLTGALPALALLATLALAERERPTTLLPSLTAAALTGTAAALLLLTLTPLRPLIPLPALAALPALGIPLGLAARALGRRLPLPPPAPFAAALAALLIAWLATIAARTALAPTAQALLEGLDLITAWLWPLWYFIGVGIIHKLLKHSKVAAAALSELLPPRLLRPTLLLTLAAATALTWSSSLLVLLDWPLPEPVHRAAAWLWQQSSPWLWQNPVRGTFADIMRWVLLAALAIALWDLIRHRRDPERPPRLLYHLAVATFFVWEYLFEFFAFNRSPAHASLVVFLFAGWLLWLVYTVGLDLALTSSPRLPARGRLTLFSGLFLLVLVVLFARTAMGDDRVRDEIYLWLFRGVVALGLPYFLYVLAQRRAGGLPVPGAHVLYAFASGGALTLLLHAGDKLATTGSWSAAMALATARLDALYAGVPTGLLPDLAPLPPGWRLARDGLALLLLAAIALHTRRRLRGAPHGPDHDGHDSPNADLPATTAVLMGAAAAGLAAFDRDATLLPFIPSDLQLLAQPWQTSPGLDLPLAATQLAWLLPALAGAAAASTLPFTLPSTLAALVLTRIATAWLWPHHAALLQSTPWLPLIALATALALLAALRAAARPRPAPFLAAASALGCALALTAWQAHTLPLTPRDVPTLAAPLPLPAHWQPVPPQPTAAPDPDGPSAPGPLAVFTLPRDIPPIPMLTAQRRPMPPGGPGALLDELVAEGKAQVPTLDAWPPQSWTRHHAGARALDFTFELPGPGGPPITLMGTTAVLPLPGGDALVLGVMADPTTWEHRRWDLIRTTTRYSETHTTH